MFEEDDRCGRAGRDRVSDVPGLGIGDQVAVRPGDSSGLGSSFGVAVTESDESTCDCTHLCGLVDREVTRLNHLDIAGVILLHDKGVDDPNELVLAQPVDLGRDLSCEFGSAKPSTSICTGPMLIAALSLS